VVVRTDGGTDTSALSTLFAAQLLPRLAAGDRPALGDRPGPVGDGGHDPR